MYKDSRKIINRYLLLFGALVFLSALFPSCCNKKECNDARYPSLYITIHGFYQPERLSGEMFIIRISDSSVVESRKLKVFDVTGDVLSTTFLVWGRSYFDVREYIYVVNTNISTDTVKNVSYNTTVKTIKCTDCNPFGMNSGTIIGYHDFSCEVSGQMQYDMDDIRIEKR